MRFLHLFTSSMFCLILGAASNGWAQETSESPNQTFKNGTVVAPPRSAGQRTGGYLGFTPSVRSSGDESVYILSVVDDGPAAESGLKADDDVVEVNGQQIKDPRDLDRAIRQAPGTTLEFTVRRDGTEHQLTVPVADRSKTPPPPAGSSVGELPSPAPAGKTLPGAETDGATGHGGAAKLEHARPQLGVRVMDADKLDEATRRQFDVSVSSGAVITALMEGAPAARAGLPLGGVIVSIDEQRIGTAEDVIQRVKSFRVGQEIEITYWHGARIGRKKLRVGPAPADYTPSRAVSPDNAPANPAVTPRRRGSDRPLLNALRGMLDDVLPAPNNSRLSDRVPPSPPPPPAEDGSSDDTAETLVPPPPPKQRGDDPPTMDIDPPAAQQFPSRGPAQEAESLRRQIVEMRQQLEALRKRVDELEQQQSP